VTVGLAEQDGEAVLSIADDGPGIPANMQERVFERFARADVARVNSAGGAGLGLSITREIVTAHGGTVTIDPACTQGVRFVVRLPLTRGACS
jgi:signal transduction histidine kinase